MKKTLLFFFFIGLSCKVYSQKNTLTISKNNFDESGVFLISQSDKWLFKKGHNTHWNKHSISTSDWQRLRPADISQKLADKNGRVEGWFRLKFRLDSTMVGVPLWLNKHTWAAAEIYLDGRLVATCGHTGINGTAFEEHRGPFFKPSIALQLIPNHTHELSIHVVDYPSKWQPYLLGYNYDQLLRLVNSSYIKNFTEEKTDYSKFYTFWLTAAILVTLLLGMLSLLEFSEKKIIRTLMITLFCIVIYELCLFLSLLNLSYFQLLGLSLALDFFTWVITFISILVLLYIIGYHPRRWVIGVVFLLGGFYAWLSVYSNYRLEGLAFIAIVQLSSLAFVIIRAWKLKIGILWVIIVGITIGFIANATNYLLPLLKLSYHAYLINSTIVALPLPLSFIIYISLRLKEMIREIKLKAELLVEASEEKQQILATQNELLERQVEARTAELKASQAQLIQKEKLASLGELTAGIAHEIQNPLNFVNNFSELSVELIEELKVERSKVKEERDEELENELLSDLRQNQEKINYHGKRASSIVKGMLEHSRQSTGERELTDLNQLADEYLRLAYHGMKAKDSNRVTTQFQADYELIADENLPLVNVVSQDIGRVLLNLINNAFYAVNQRRNLQGLQDLTGLNTYQPKVTVTTKVSGNAIEIKVQDNGTGMSDATKAKIFQPFFTTKPTGEGTGLGLSLAYDIITKGHGGTLEVESVEDEGTTFTIKLPIQNN